MIKYESRYFNNAHRISDIPIDPVVTVLYDGQWMQISDTGTAVISDGTANKRSYMTISSMYGNFTATVGAEITGTYDASQTLIGSSFYPLGRDTVTPTGTVSLLIGPFRMETDQYDTAQVYHAGNALKVNATGKLTLWASGVDSGSLIVGYVSKVPANAQDTIGVIHE